MAEIYFVRHAQPNYENHDDMTRELSAKGMADRQLVTDFLQKRNIEVVLSSPYRRAVDTVGDFAAISGIHIGIIDDFRERKIGNEWIDDFNAFARKQWEDFEYKLPDGESLREVRERNIRALREILQRYPGKNIAIGSHGTALSTVISFYDQAFGYADFREIQNLMPWIVQMTFDGLDCIGIRKINLFEN